MERYRSSTSGNVLEYNPFFKNAKDSVAAIWAIENEYKVKTKIKYTLQKMGHGLKEDINDVYGMLIDYLILSGNDFDENFFITELLKNEYNIDDIDDKENLSPEELELIDDMVENNTYKISNFVINRAYYTAMGYVSDLNRSKEMIRMRESLEDYDGIVSSARLMLEDKVYEIAGRERKFSEDNPEVLCEYAELQDILDYDIEIYQDDFATSLKGFRIRRFIEVMFLMGLTDDRERAEVYGVPVTAFQNMVSGFKILVKERANRPGDRYYDLKESLTILCEGFGKGWQPELETGI